jgi:hypothetical protein
VAIANGRVAAFSAFASAVGIALIPVEKGEPETDIRLRAAISAVAEALKIPVDGMKVTPLDNEKGKYIVTLPVTAGEHDPTLLGKTFQVKTARDKDFIVATTACEAGRL